MNLFALVAGIALVGANAFFVAFEFSLVAARRARLEQRVEEGAGARRARMALAATTQLSQYIAGVQLGITMASLGLGAVAEPAVDDALHSLFGLGGVIPDAVLAPAAFAIALGIVVFSHTVFGEMVPKSLAIADAERALLWLAAPMRAFLVVFRPVIAVLDALAGAGLRLLRVERREELLSASTAEELSRLLTESAEHGVIAQPQHELLSGAIEFGQRTVDAVMTPRERIVAVSTATSVTEAEAVLVASGISRLPVYARGRDDMVGFVHAKDLLSVPEEDHERPIPRRLLRRMLMVGQHRSLDAVLVAMRRSRLHLALVVDENGRTAGLVTLEDVLEQLVGAISDETDVDAPPAERS